MSKRRIVVVCPGRGSYTAENLGYIKKNIGVALGDGAAGGAPVNPLRALASEQLRSFVRDIDERRRHIGEPTITELDNKEKFSPALHTRGEHASTLIYSCAYIDFMNIDREKYEIVAVCGNSMGWYLSLAMGGALDWEGAFQVIQSMGSMMKSEIVGGQVIYPIVDEEWRRDPERERVALDTMAKINAQGLGEVHVSIWLGGFLVFGGDKAGAAALLKMLPKTGDYPFQLINHAAFHTPLLYETSRRAFEMIPQHYFTRPKLPLIDGRGVIWQPYSTDIDELYAYTLGHQVYAPYDFTASITVALKEFAPDYLWLLGPGASLGGAIGQILVKNEWHGISSKTDFKNRSKEILSVEGMRP